MAESPEELHRAWAERFSAGDAAGLLDLYEEDAVLVPEPGAQPLRGKAAVGEGLSGFLALNADFQLVSTRVVAADDLAVAYSKWTLKGGSDPAGQPLDMAGETTDVMRRGAGGEWKFAIDNPWGVA